MFSEWNAERKPIPVSLTFTDPVFFGFFVANRDKHSVSDPVSISVYKPDSFVEPVRFAISSTLALSITIRKPDIVFEPVNHRHSDKKPIHQQHRLPNPE